MEYKATLNMPKSGFPMRAGLPQREPAMLENWKKIDIYKALLEKNAGKPGSSSTTARPSPTAISTWVMP